MEALVYFAVGAILFTAYCKNREFRNLVDNMEDE